MPALTLRLSPLPRVAAVRALSAVVLAMVGGAGLALAVVALASDGEIAAGAGWWVALAGACACASGAIVGNGGHASVAAAFAVAAVAAIVLATAPGTVHQHDAAFPARKLPPPAHADRATTAPRRQRPTHAGPADLVRSYYAALDAGDFERAWARLTPKVQAAFGGFETWRRGYATTRGHRVEHVTVAPGGVVRLVLVATDRAPCGGTTEQRFAVTWRLAGRRATALSAVKLAGEVPAAAC